MSAPSTLTAAEIIQILDLSPHPEGGHYRETFRDSKPTGGRAASTLIYFLLAGDERSHWHRVDAAEVWHWYAGAALELGVGLAGPGASYARLGPDLIAGERPQIVVPSGYWQSARSFGPWTLAGCTVAPGFDFDGFELAPAGFDLARATTPRR